MQELSDEPGNAARGFPAREVPNLPFRLEFVALRQHLPLLLAITVISVGFAAAYLQFRVPSYTAAALLVVDNRLLLIQKDAIFTTSSQPGSAIQTELEILKSPKVISRALEIAHTPAIESMLTAENTWRRLATAAGIVRVAEDTIPSDQRLRRLAARLKQHVDARRVPGTALIEVRATAPEPTIAAALANAVTAAYLEDQAEANTAVARSATAWVRESVKNAGTVSRVLSSGTPPLTPDGPRPITLLAGALGAGALAGAFAAMLKGHFFKRVRSSIDAAQIAGAECFGVLPLQKRTRRRSRLCADSEPVARKLGAFGGAYDWSLAPRSIFSDTIRRASVAAILENPRIATIGVTSCFRGEGKTTLAVNLARSTAAAGYRVLLVDSTPDAELTRQLTNSQGLTFDQVLSGTATMKDACWVDPATGMHFVGGAWTGTAFLAKDAPQLIAQVAREYDLVVFDLPAAEHEAHTVRAAASALDGLLLVIEYAHTKPHACERCLTYAAPCHPFYGAVLNKVDRRGLRRFARRGEPHAL
jgi:polysaccharide biosynthesis transport protein